MANTLLTAVRWLLQTVQLGNTDNQAEWVERLFKEEADTENHWSGNKETGRSARPVKQPDQPNDSQKRNQSRKNKAYRGLVDRRRQSKLASRVLNWYKSSRLPSRRNRLHRLGQWKGVVGGCWLWQKHRRVLGRQGVWQCRRSTQFLQKVKLFVQIKYSRIR